MCEQKISGKCRSLFVACLIFGSLAVTTEKPLTITDYLLLIPENYLGFKNSKITAPERMDMIEENDGKNGWLKLVGKGENTFEGWIELALFSKGPSGTMLGVAVHHCGPACSQQIYFLQYKQGSWEEITALVFQPLPGNRVKELYKANFLSDEFTDDPPVLYRLPRRGTDILLVTQEAIVGREVILARFNLTNGHFIRQQP